MSNLKEAVVKGVRKILPEMWFEFLWDSYVARNPKYEINRYRLAYFKKGKKTKKRYCILRYSAPRMGIGAAARNCLLACEWAEKHGMIPIIDLEFEYLFKHNMVGKENMWDYVFEQEVSVQEIYEQYSVFVGEIDKRYFLPSMSQKLLGSKEESIIKFKTEDWREYYRQLNVFSNKWWILRPEIKKQFEDRYAELFKPEMKVLGVALREEFSLEKEAIEGTFLVRHPHEPKLEDMIQLVKKYKKEWNCTHIFVTTIFEDSIRAFEKEFGSALLYIEKKRANFNEKGLRAENWEKYTPDEIYHWANEKKGDMVYDFANKERMIKYVEEMYGIAACDCLLSSKNGGSLFACILNGGNYEKLKIIEDDNKSNLY